MWKKLIHYILYILYNYIICYLYVSLDRYSNQEYNLIYWGFKGREFFFIQTFFAVLDIIIPTVRIINMVKKEHTHIRKEFLF